MKRYFASIAVVSLAALVVVTGTAVAQTKTNPTGNTGGSTSTDTSVSGGVSGAGSVTGSGNASGSGSTNRDTTTQSPSASPSMGDDKVKPDNNDRDQMKQQEQIDKKTGLDRADEAAGSHGTQGRDNARTRGNRQ